MLWARITHGLHTIKTLGLLAAHAFSLGRANGVCDSRLSALLSFVGLLVFLLLHLLHLDVLKRGLDLTQVLPEILDRARQHATFSRSRRSTWPP